MQSLGRNGGALLNWLRFSDGSCAAATMAPCLAVTFGRGVHAEGVSTMRRVLPLKFLMIALLAACVTVNVYFPAAAAEKAADQIIDTVTGQQNQTTPPSNKQQSSTVKPSSDSMVWVAFARAVDLLIPTANAQANANLDISTPEIRAVTGSMQQRFGELKKYFDSGVVGLTADGSVDVRDQNAVPLAERATVKRLVSEDNKDRATLYAEIAKANGHPEWEPEIRRIFAKRWVERGAQPGWYYHDSGGSWQKK
jgi:uncharacterized protein YdbL (DUF1318 family)